MKYLPLLLLLGACCQTEDRYETVSSVAVSVENCNAANYCETKFANGDERLIDNVKVGVLNSYKRQKSNRR